MARELHPGQRNSLDALSGRYQVDVARNLHGALLDARILLDVYLAMTGGQSSLLLGEEDGQGLADGQQRGRPVKPRAGLKIVEPSVEELAEHQRIMQQLGARQGTGNS